MSKQAPILVADDDKDDIFFFRRAFEKAGLTLPILSVEDGEEVLEYLTGTGRYQDREQFPIPGLLVLDIKMPRKSGFEVLSWLRTRDQFQDLPVVVLSSSSLEADVHQARQLGAADFFTKSGDVQKMQELVKTLVDRFLSLAV